MVNIYKDGEYFTTAESESSALVLLDLFKENGADISQFEIREE